MSTEFVVQCMYAADPFGVIGGEVALAGNNELVAQVLPQTAGISMESVLSPFQNVPLESPLETILAKKSISLSSQVLYGSSRLGTMNYLSEQYGMSYHRVSHSQSVYDTIGLHGHRPYYSFAGNQLATGGVGSYSQPFWMNQSHTGQHLIGQKQYELTNHLGNVQVTVSDLPYKHGNDTITRISPALKAVYDYYPFGSPMPGRTVMDTARKCVDMTRLDRVWKAWEMTQTEIYALSLINYHLDGEGEVFIDDNGAVEVETADEHAVFYMELQDSLNNGGEMVLHVDWLKEFSEKGFQLYVQGLDAAGEMRVFYQKYYKNPEDVVYLSIADSFTNVSVGIQGNVHFRIDNIRYTGGSWVNEEVLVRVCDEVGDRYRFGFNGQEKVNEMSGMGNHNTAEFWEYDTRLGRRWNVDPKSGLMPNESPYAVNHGNPIVYKDTKGDFGFIGAAIGAVAGAVIEYGSQSVSNLIQGKSIKDAFWNEIDFADVGVSAAEGALAGTTGGASLIVTRVTAGDVRASVYYTPNKKWQYVGGEGERKKAFKDILLDAGSEVVGGLVGKGFDKAGSKEFIRKAPRSLFKGGAKKAMQALEAEVLMRTVESAVPTIIDGAVKGEVKAGQLVPLGYEDHQTKEFIPYNRPFQTQAK